MPAHTALQALIRDLEQASGSAATVSDRGDYICVSVPAPAGRGAHRAVLDVLSRAAWWGSSDATGKLLLWGAVPKVQPDSEAQAEERWHQ
jgi:hypothetical protein